MTDGDEFYDYDAYIHSNIWHERASRIRKRDGFRCCICGATDTALEVHHLTYDRLYHEDDDDLMTVCHECHKKITKSWNDTRDAIKARRRFFALIDKYRRCVSVCNHLNTLMPYDISFGGRHVLTGKDNIVKACEAAGIEYKHMQSINDRFNKIHILDVVDKINNGMQKWQLKQIGYPKALVDQIAQRKQKNDDVVTTISDELICYLHEGNGKWIAVGEEDGLQTEWRIRFMPYIRYENRWWDNG